MRNLLIFATLTLALASSAAAQDKVFEWQKASDEMVRLDPFDYHTGRVYHQGSGGGNMHIIVQSKLPITVAMTWADAWDAALSHPDRFPSLDYRCIREHVVNTVYECHLPPGGPMVLVMHDERAPDKAIVQGIEAIVGGGIKKFISPNDVQITYFRWACIQNCIQPEFRWFSIVKERYPVTSHTKLYSLFTPERDGQPVNVRIKTPMPVTVAVLSSKLADHVYDHPETLGDALDQTTCKQRGIQQLTFDCTVNQADGPQSLIIVPDQPVKNHKKAEIELQAVQCTDNCNLMNREVKNQ
jgi:hypothetical protein